MPKKKPGESETAPEADTGDAPADTHLDSGVVEEPARERLSDFVRHVAHNAHCSGDAQKHADLHQLELELGAMKRAATKAAQHFAAGSEERGFLDRLASEL